MCVVGVLTLLPVVDIKSMEQQWNWMRELIAMRRLMLLCSACVLDGSAYSQTEIDRK